MSGKFATASAVDRLTPMMSSACQGWNTPDVVCDLVRKLGDIGLDPCSNNNSRVLARCTIELPSDGLTSSWVAVAEGGLVYVNPPYGREIGPWVQKCATESAQGATVVALLPARPDARWFQNVWTADAVCFWRGRLTFLGAPASAPFPSVVVFWGRDRRRFAEIFGAVGKVVFP